MLGVLAQRAAESGRRQAPEVTEPVAAIRLSRTPALALLSLALLAHTTPAATQENPKMSLFRGSDGAFDMSGYLATRGGFLPVPIVITEPAVGYGGGLGAAFFHGGNPFRPGRPASEGGFVPPSISAAGAFATENGSKGGGGGHFGVWKNDRIRYIGAVGGASLNLDWWGTPERPLDEPLTYNVEGAILVQRLMFRVGDSPFMLGGEASYSTQKAKFDTFALPPGSPPRSLDQDDAGVAALAEYETLDNLFSPNRGIKARVRGKIFSESLGGDNDRETLDVEGFGYVTLRPDLILGARADFCLSNGDTPFYLLPYLSMRGLPALKYAGKHAVLGELELRWDITRRWSLVGFGGSGRTASSFGELDSADGTQAFGGGFRYLIAERLGLRAGIDYGQGPDDSAIYFIVGNAWR